MGDRLDAVAGAGAGLFGWAIGLPILQTVIVVLLTHAIHAFVMAWMGWNKVR